MQTPAAGRNGQAHEHHEEDDAAHGTEEQHRPVEQCRPYRRRQPARHGGGSSDGRAADPQAEHGLARCGSEHRRGHHLVDTGEQRGEHHGTARVEGETPRPRTQRITTEQPLVDLDDDEGDQPGEHDDVDDPSAGPPSERRRWFSSIDSFAQGAEATGHTPSLPMWPTSQPRRGSTSCPPDSPPSSQISVATGLM